MRTFHSFALLIAALTVGAISCNFTPAGVGTDPVPSRETTESDLLDEGIRSPEDPSNPAADFSSPEEICLTAGVGESLYINEAGGYCFILPEGYEIRQDTGLDIFVVGPTLATFGMDSLVLAFDFSVVGAPGKADRFDAAGWGGQVAADNSTPGFELLVEPYTFIGAGLQGVKVGPIPGIAGGEALIVRENETLYSIMVYPDPAGFPEYAQEVEDLQMHLSSTTRFFPPVDTGIEYRTDGEVCPNELPGTRFVINYSEGWCTLIPADWQEDVEFMFPGRFVGGPNIGEFWPGQPPYTNIVIGYNGPALDITLNDQVEGRINANGRPDLVERSDAVIGGFPAVILTTQDGPHPERVAFVHANGHIYTVLGQPFDPVNYPEAQASLATAWEQVIGTIQFFEPYR